MWTYLIIFFCVAVVFAIFIRRVLFVLNKKGGRPPKQDLMDDDNEDLPAIPAPENLTKSEEAEVEDLCKKGEELLNSGKEDESIKVFVQALTINGLHVETQQKLAVLYMKKQMFAAASALFKQLCEITNDPVHYSHLGLSLYQQNSFEEARDAYQQAIDLDPSRPQRYVSLAQVYKAMEQFQNAIISLNKAIEMEKENMDFLFLMVELQAASGNTEEAIISLRKLLQIDPENAEAKILLKNLLKSLSD